METFYAYIPQDRRELIDALPEHASGSALFADISGFTPLTEALTKTLGLRRGAEELSIHLNQVYDALIAEVDRFGGSVIGFAGDAILCWFDESRGNAALRAAASALAMQEAMKPFASELTIRIAIASGEVRRFLVGDPNVQVMDVLAGETIERMSRGERTAQSGETLIDEASAARLGASIQIVAWRDDRETNQRFRALEKLFVRVEEARMPSNESVLREEQIRKWILPSVYERVQAGLGEFLTELRPAAALFLRFGGIDYEARDAGAKLDAYIRWAQSVLARYDGTLVQLTVGDKGSYLYGVFGAPTAHENDVPRAANAALELSRPSADLNLTTQIGIARGMMRTGSYGSSTRRTYGCLGDEANLAARLMESAKQGEILISGAALEALGSSFIAEALPPIQVKGRREPTTIARLIERNMQWSLRMLEPTYTLPMVGRASELELISKKLELARAGKGQIVAITAEAGMGKSRLAAEAIKQATARRMAGYGGACQSYGVNTPYLVWQNVWRGFFDVDPNATLEEQTRQLESALKDIDPQALSRLPLLGLALGLPIPDNDLTRGFDAKLRKESLEALLVDCLKARSKTAPLLFALEDLHWMDPLSHDLLEALGRAIANLPALILLVYRPMETERLQSPRLSAMNHFTEIQLAEFTETESERLMELRLGTMESDSLAQLKVKVAERAQGNPFYIEELLNYLRDLGLDPFSARALTDLDDLPPNLHNLILSRMDRLNEREKATLKVASVIGRLFKVNWLHGYYPSLGKLNEIQDDLEKLRRLDLTPLETPEPNLTYLFKHIVTQEVAYTSMTHVLREELHEKLGRYLEELYPDAPPLDALAYHYGRSGNLEKKIEYLRRAGDAAQAAYANEAALDYFEKLFPLLNAPLEKIDLLLQWSAVLELTGRWDQVETREREALSLAQAIDSNAHIALCLFALGKLFSLRGDYFVAAEWLEKAKAEWAALNDTSGLCQTLIGLGDAQSRKGDHDLARRSLEDGLNLARSIHDKPSVAQALNNLGVLSHFQGDYSTARTFYEESLILRREMDHKRDVAKSLNNLGTIADFQGDYAAAQIFYEESLALRREMGDKDGISASIGNLGNIFYNFGDYPKAQSFYENALALNRELGSKNGISINLNNLGNIAYAQKDYAAALAFYEDNLELKRETRDKRGVAASLTNLGLVANTMGDNDAAQGFYNEALILFREINDRATMAYALIGLGMVALEQVEPTKAKEYMKESLSLRVEVGDKHGGIVASLIGVAGAISMDGDPRNASRLFGAAEAIMASIQGELEPEIKSLRARVIESILKNLDEESFNALSAEGKTLTQEQALALALS